MTASGVYKIPFNLMEDINRKTIKEFAGIERILGYLIIHKNYSIPSRN
jgi:hypothetical protein